MDRKKSCLRILCPNMFKEGKGRDDDDMCKTLLAGTNSENKFIGSVGHITTSATFNGIPPLPLSLDSNDGDGSDKEEYKIVASEIVNYLADKATDLLTKSEENNVDMNSSMYDGSICSICMDMWSSNGPHRLVSLKCGHLFGDSCIRQWLDECKKNGQVRVCPQCKKLSSPREIRTLFAKKICVADNSKEDEILNELLEEKKRFMQTEKELSRVKSEYRSIQERVKELEDHNKKLMQDIKRKDNANRFHHTMEMSHNNSSKYELQLQKTIKISTAPGCRVLAYAKKGDYLLVSQKSSMSMCPGYGVRLIDLKSFKFSSYFHSSNKIIRDMTLSANEKYMALASIGTLVSVYDITQNSIVHQIPPHNNLIWCCNFGCEDLDTHLYLGAQQGQVFVYDIRQASQMLRKYGNETSSGPVICIRSVPPNSYFPFGGILVCKLTSLWFYENVTDVPTQVCLFTEGPFISMDYEPSHDTLLLVTRRSASFTYGRCIIGRVIKTKEDLIVLLTLGVFKNSVRSPVMARSTQIGIEEDLLMCTYMQDSKVLTLYDVRAQRKTQTIPSPDIAYDMKALSLDDGRFLAALTEYNCNFYKIKNENP